MRKGYAALAVVGVAAAVAVFALSTFSPETTSLSSIDHTYSSYISKYGKSYGTKEEYLHRRAHFEQTMKEISEVNAQNHNLTYYLGINEFADWTDSEKKKLTGLVLPTGHHSHDYNYTELDTSYNGAVDWRGYMPAVKNQGSCGSCWAFSAIGAIEGHNAMRTGQISTFSEQQLVDCSSGYGNQGCSGGWYYYAFSYAQAYGIASSSSYPYTGYQGSCSYSGSASVKVSTYTNVQKYSVAQLQAALQYGPVSVAVEASGSTFYYYKGGIINANCGTNLDHAVLAVGYSDSYWIVRNSWGSGWGESGYVRIAIGSDGYGMCGILSGPPSWPQTN